jgi:hypothetical protein
METEMIGKKASLLLLEPVHHDSDCREWPYKGGRRDNVRKL